MLCQIFWDGTHRVVRARGLQSLKLAQVGAMTGTAVKNEIDRSLTARLMPYWWAILAAALLAIQGAFAAMVGLGTRWTPSVGTVYVVSFVPILLGAGVSALNAIRSGQAVRLFWSFFSLFCLLWAVNAWSWVYSVAVLHEDHPIYLFASIPLFLQPIFLIAAVASRPHVKLARDKPYRATSNFLQLLLFWFFAYAFVLCPVSYTQWDAALIQRGGILYAAENFSLIAVLVAAAAAVRPPWRGIFGQLLGASVLYALGSLAEHVVVVSGTRSAGIDDLFYTAAACWFVSVALRGRRLARELTESVLIDPVNPKYVSTLAMGTVVAIPIIGIWELFRVDELYSTRLNRLLIILLAIFFMAVIAFIMERFSQRELTSGTDRANERLRMAMASGKSVGRELDLATGQDLWFGDLRTIFGIEGDSFTGRMEDFLTYVHPDDRQRVTQAVTDARMNHELYEAEFRIVRRDGVLHWVSARGSFHYANDGRPERMLGMAVDITERKHAEEAVKTSEEKFSKAFRESPMALTLTRVKDYRYLDVNQTFLQLTGWQRDEVIGRTPFDLQIWVNPTERLEVVKRVQTEGSIRNLEFRFRCKDGTERVALGSAELINVADEQCLLSVVADITDRKQAELALSKSEERFRRVAEHINDALIVDDAAGHVVYANDRFLQLFGCDRKQLPGLKLEDYVAPEHRGELRDRHNRRMRGEAVTTHFEYEGIRSDGRRMWLEVDVVPVTDQDGILVGTQSAIRDVTERRLAEQSLHESEERFRLVANTAPVMIWMAGPDKLCTYFNRPWLEFTGRPLETELGNGWAESVHPEDMSACLDAYGRAFDQRQPFDMQYRVRRHDGEYRWLLDTAVPRFEQDGSFAGYIGSCIDVTDRKLAEEALANMGRRLIEAHEEERTWIARELHDDINQRLALLAIELERWNQHVPETLADAHAVAQKARKRLFDISKDVQSLSHRLHSSKLEYLGITAAANSFCKEFSEQHKVQVEFSHSDIPHTLPAEVSLALFRVLQESLQNAAKHSGAQEFKVDLRGIPGEVHLTVSDPGVGFDQAAVMNGRGLGLISLRERLRLVNGSVVIDSKLAHGTVIRVRVPIQSKSDQNPVTLAG